MEVSQSGGCGGIQKNHPSHETIWYWKRIETYGDFESPKLFLFKSPLKINPLEASSGTLVCLPLWVGPEREMRWTPAIDPWVRRQGEPLGSRELKKNMFFFHGVNRGKQGYLIFGATPARHVWESAEKHVEFSMYRQNQDLPRSLPSWINSLWDEVILWDVESWSLLRRPLWQPLHR